jgi:transcriptional regulator with XRE-family HTH domain
MSDVGVWLNKKFLEWQNMKGMPQKQKEFAAYLGVKPTTYSGWVNDDIPPSGDNLHKLAAKLGYEIYAIIGVEPPSPIIKALHEVQAAYDALPPEGQDELMQRAEWIIEDTLKKYGARRVK